VCLADARRRHFDETLVLGDIVGYGADPNAAIERIRALKPKAIVRGNHDKVACGIEHAEGFNAVARAAAEWTYEALEPGNREWLAALPQGPIVVDDLVEICHGSPTDEDLYIFDETDALRALKSMTRQLCLFGHTHFPITFQLTGGELQAIGPSASPEVTLELKEDVLYLVNPGAVGQPRDGDARAAYAIVDVERKRVEMLRLDYRIEATQAKVVDAGLPVVLAKRLAVGR
jgi:diadenosine tetraphosphatase ApaH/serine/threonine PP2A family protein phosphatase